MYGVLKDISNVNYIAKGLPPCVKMSPRHTEHVQNEKHGLGEAMYEEILPQTKDEGTVIIELKENVAYSTSVVPQ